jgi:hypothetical protein
MQFDENSWVSLFLRTRPAEPVLNVLLSGPDKTSMR